MAGNNFQVNVQANLELNKVQAQLKALGERAKPVVLDVKMKFDDGVTSGGIPAEISKRLEEVKKITSSQAKLTGESEYGSDAIKKYILEYEELGRRIKETWIDLSTQEEVIWKRKIQLVDDMQRREKEATKTKSTVVNAELSEIKQQAVARQSLENQVQEDYRQQMAYQKLLAKEERDRENARLRAEKRYADARRQNAKERERQAKQDAAIAAEQMRQDEIAARQRQRELQEMQRIQDYARRFLARSQKLQRTPEVERGRNLAQQIIGSNDIEQIRTLNREMRVNDAVVRQASKAMWSWSEQFKVAIGRIIEYGLSYRILQGIINEFSSGLRHVIDLSKELTNILVLQTPGAKTTEQIEQLGDSFNQLAIDMGVSTLEVAKGSVEWLNF